MIYLKSKNMDNIQDFEVNSPRWLSLEDFDGEVWKYIPGFENNYMASNLGRIKSLERDDVYYRSDYKTTCVRHRKAKILHLGHDKDGYYGCIPCLNGKRFMKKVHKLIALTFIPNPNNFLCINHKNEVKTDNRVVNLEWCTALYNLKYGTALERAALHNINNPLRSKTIYQYDLDGKFVNHFPSISEASRKTGINSSKIGYACKKRGIAGDYIWSFRNKPSDIKVIISHIKNRRSGSKRVTQFSKEGVYVREYKSAKEAERITGIKSQAISACCKNYRGIVSAGGFVWRFTGDTFDKIKL